MTSAENQAAIARVQEAIVQGRVITFGETSVGSTGLTYQPDPQPGTIVVEPMILRALADTSIELPGTLVGFRVTAVHGETLIGDRLVELDRRA